MKEVLDTKECVRKCFVGQIEFNLNEIKSTIDNLNE